MYCSACGGVLAEGLSYCNRCGANLSPTEFIVPRDRPKVLIAPIIVGLVMTTGLALGGLAVVFAFAMEFFRHGFPIEATVILSILGLLTLFKATTTLSGQMSRLMDAFLEPGEVIRKQKPQLSGAPPAQLDAPRVPVSSITDHTTRNFAPIYRERDTYDG